jgi:predicted flavoprotein YhiN
MKGLGIESYVGSSGRIFPVEMKAAPLLRAWLKRLQNSRLNSFIVIVVLICTNGNFRKPK